MKDEIIGYKTEFVEIVSLTDELTNNHVSEPEYCHSIKDILEMIGDCNLTDQIYMMCNLLTISGFSQKEIAKRLGVSYQTYRNRLWTVRKDLLNRTN